LVASSQRRPLAAPRVRASGVSSGGRVLSAAAPGSVPAAGAQSGSSTASATRPHRIDIHHHVAPPKYIDEMRALLQPPTIAWTPEKTLADMDEAGVAASITSITTPGVWIGDHAQGRRVARDCNDYSAKLAADHPGRFGMFAALPLPDVEGSLRELEYGFDVLKADGIVLFTSYRDKWLGDPAFEPVMEELNRRKALVFTHPEAPLCCRNLIPGINEAVIEYGTDTARAIARLLFTGTAYRFPDIKWIFSHGGGTIPYLTGRIATMSGQQKGLATLAPQGIEYEMRQLYYEIAASANAPAMAALMKLAPLDHIMFGTDYPFVQTEATLAPLEKLGLSATELRAISRESAAKLLSRWKV
jgi:predicted TIM-barrel fold metal-dependent hydrolase